VDSEAIRPITVTSGGALYPTNEEVEAVYRQATEHLCIVPGAEIARRAGNARAANIVLLGALSAFLDLPEETWLEVIAGRVPAKYLELNRQAFLRGREAACSR
jgi:indolepyruvate ferredoxin oxidoreductase beta subunit